MFRFTIFFVCIYSCFATESAKSLQRQLKQAQTRFNEARKAFNPWYAGPLLTGSAHVLPPGQFNIQPYLFFTTTYAKYTADRQSISIPDETKVRLPSYFQLGLFRGVDLTFGVEISHAKKRGISSAGFSDTTATFGIALVEEDAYTPSVKLALTESFPTGKFDQLDPHKGGIDAKGSGSFTTSIQLDLSKVVWFFSSHPISLRSSLAASIPSKVTVKGAHAYGGGQGTKGTVRPGFLGAVNFAFEYSFTQRWVAACDFSYFFQNKSRFSGTPGKLQGLLAKNTSPYEDQLSLAPALEYSPSANQGLIGGVWFPVYGKRSSKFISGILSHYIVF